MSDDTSLTPIPPDRPYPEQVGPYRILDWLGEGGMGMVLLAEQKEPGPRLVALKIIKLGMDSKEILARFDAERHALARMQHTNIATVFDGGLTEDGRSYFVMEYVPGESLTAYCDRKRLGIRERLQLFAEVCEGVQHAHQKGVIHRDLKPGNILVKEEDDQPIPKIIDFGLARATDYKLTEMTLHTEQGRPLGTPEYMSPEQAGAAPDIDTRSDIYSLGVILYELLVGELPISSAELRRAGLLEMMRKIREDEPRSPSTRVSDLATPQRAEARQLDTRGFKRVLSGDLDWITMKALEKDRSRRYATAGALVDDLVAHVESRPVSASPPSAAYKLRKWARRHRRAVATSAVLLVALFSGGGFGLWNYVDAREAERATLLEADPLLLRELERQADEDLWPATSTMLPPMQSWLDRAEALAARLPEHRAHLERLRAVPPAAETTELHAHRLERHSAFLQNLEELATAESSRIDDIRDRQQRARTIHERSVQAHAEAWQRATDAIVQSDRYAIAAMQPQEGLVPLGANAAGLWEFLVLESGEAPDRGAEGGWVITPDTGIVLILVPGGEIVTGAAREEAHPRYDPKAVKNEGPPLTLRVDPYFLSRYEMTQAQWTRVTGKNPSWFIETFHGGPIYPVESITWYESVKTLRQLDLQLPTEVQWERACRAGTDGSWSFGAVEAMAEHANVADKACVDKNVKWAPDDDLHRGLDDGFFATAPVDGTQDGELRLKPNGFGFHHMHGNVGEWCRDNYTGNYKAGGRDGDGLLNGGDPERAIMRGGMYLRPVWQARSAHRPQYSRTNRTTGGGVRPARPLRDFELER